MLLFSVASGASRSSFIRSIMRASSGYMAEPPNGYIRHMTNPSNVHKSAVVGISTTILAVAAVILRIFTRSHVTKNGIHLDDCRLLHDPYPASG